MEDRVDSAVRSRVCSLDSVSARTFLELALREYPLDAVRFCRLRSSALMPVLRCVGQVLGSGDSSQFEECGADEGLMRARFKSLSRCIYWSAMTITTVVRLSIARGYMVTPYVFLSLCPRGRAGLR